MKRKPPVRDIKLHRIFKSSETEGGIIFKTGHLEGDPDQNFYAISQPDLKLLLTRIAHLINSAAKRARDKGSKSNTYRPKRRTKHQKKALKGGRS